MGAGHYNLGFAEVSKFIVMGPTSTPCLHQPVDLTIVAFNGKDWNELSAPTRGLLTELVRAFSYEHFTAQQEANIKACADFEAAGVEVTRLSEADVERLRRVALSALAMPRSRWPKGTCAQLPEPSGRDEVARLMRALTVFRDTAAEIEESNLREIAQARQRLFDAIESISEGFALFDGGERLVLANSRYREIMLGDAATACEPGIAFTDIIALSAREKQFPRGETDPGWGDRQVARSRGDATQWRSRRSGA